MKKILVTLIGIVAGASLVHAQGFLELFDNGGGVSTNTGTFGNPTTPNGNANYNSIISGKTSTTLGQFDYALLFVSSGSLASSADSNNLAATDWVQLYTDVSGNPGVPLAVTNATFAGGIDGQGGNASVQAIGAASQAFNNGTTYSIALLGWSSNLGTTWSSIVSQYTGNAWNAAGNFGYVISSVNPANGAPGITLTAMFPNSSLTLYSVAPAGVPEPATIALAGLGGLSMLFLRRRKS
jgi:hypothetical protein